jgi:hypothetical protein
VAIRPRTPADLVARDVVTADSRPPGAPCDEQPDLPMCVYVKPCGLLRPGREVAGANPWPAGGGPRRARVLNSQSSACAEVPNRTDEEEAPAWPRLSQLTEGSAR